MRALSRINAKEKGSLPARQCMKPYSDYLKGTGRMIDPYFFLHSKESVGVGENSSYHCLFCFSDRKQFNNREANSAAQPDMTSISVGQVQEETWMMLCAVALLACVLSI